MRLLYLPNEPTPGWQAGPRAALERLAANGTLSRLETYSFLQAPAQQAHADILARARETQPDVILFTKVGDFPVSASWLDELRNVTSRPLLAYYDGDLYGCAFKRMSRATSIMCAQSDAVFVCGLGKQAARFRRRGARRIYYLRHNASTAQFDARWTPTHRRDLDVVVIGNRIHGRFALQDRLGARLPGSAEREELVRRLGQQFGRRFAVYGAGWTGFVGDRGPLAFDRQLDAIRESWLSVGYDHFPGTPYYFSDRLPISMLSGVAHVTHYHPGYDRLFRHGRELLWGYSVSGVVETVRDALLGDRADLIALGERGRDHAMTHLTSDRAYAEAVGVLQQGRRGQWPVDHDRVEELT